MNAKLQIFLLTFFNVSVMFSQAGTFCWREISAGQNYTLGIKSDGTMWGWGANGNLLGQNGNPVANQNLPIQIGTANDWLTVSAGANHSLAVKTNGTLWAWGSGNLGQLGDGLNSATWTVTQIGVANDWLKVSAGSAFSIALKINGTLWAWGLNNTGQLGIGNLINQNVPNQVGTSSSWSKIEAGHEHALAIDNFGFVFAWGNNTFGQLGDGTNTNSLSPIPITTSPGWTDISAGFDHSLFLNNAQFLFSCGSNTNGQLSNGTNIASNTLIPATADGSLAGYIAISAGQTHTLAIRNDFTLWSSGLNSQGQLGLGTFTNVNVLNQVGIGTNWASVSAGFIHSHAMENSTDLWSAGRGSEGQLGVGSFIGSNVFVLVNCPTLSIQENFNNETEINIFPNPTNSFLKINYNLVNSTKITVRVTNIQGQIIKEFQAERNSGSQTETIDFSNHSNGLFFVTLITETNNYTTKVIKQ